MTASLPMYNRREVSEAHLSYWQAIRAEILTRGVPCPAVLSEPVDLPDHWLAPGLVLSQTCGMPYRLWLHDKVKLVGTPDFGVDDCAAGYYRSAIVVREDDWRVDLSEYRGAVFAYNQTHSQSGFAAIYQHCKSLGFWFSKTVETGAHFLSAEAVVRGKADIAAIDAVTWRLLLRHESGIEALKVLDWTVPTPGLPYITSMTRDESLIFDAVSAAIRKLPDNTKSELQLRGLIKIPKDKYLAVPNPDI